MITNNQILCQLSPDLQSGFFPPDSRPSDFLFFDIETTGLSPKTSRTFLIGFLVESPKKGIFQQIQLLAERSDDQEETAVLKAFAFYARGKKYLVHFNGSAFDLPYLRHRYHALGMASPFEDTVQIDLYRKLLQWRGFFRQMPNHRLKTFENLVSYTRKDLLSGKEMIDFYQNFQKSKNSDILKLLFLHNQNDLEGMIQLLVLGRIEQLLKKEYEISKIEEVTHPNVDGILDRELLFTLTLKQPIPVPLSASAASFCYITVLNSKAKIKMPLFEGTLRYYYPDYKNYYYLPYEDEAIHKSVGAFIDPSRREKAKAANCCQKVGGTFVYAPEDFGIPLLRETYHSKEQYALWPFSDTSHKILKSYLHSILKTAITEK